MGNLNEEILISRQAVHEAIEKWAGSMSVLIALPTSEVRPLLDSIHKLPPVKPQERTGHWIEKMDACECPYCHKAWDYCDNDTEDFDYCPKCGARMSEIPTSSESEDKEIKTNTHIVIKREDIFRYLTDNQIKYFDVILNAIAYGRKKDGKKTDNSYYICNTDEPYANEVLEVILKAEREEV